MTDMQVYVITAGEYSAYQIYRVCRTRAQAEAWCAQRPPSWDGWNIEEWPTDEDGYFYGQRYRAGRSVRLTSSFTSFTPEWAVYHGWSELSPEALPNHKIQSFGMWQDFEGIRPPEIEVFGGVAQRDGFIGSEFGVSVVGYDKDRVEKVLADEWTMLLARYLEEHPSE